MNSRPTPTESAPSLEAPELRPRITLRLLGDFALSVAGTPRTLARRKAAALLAWLVLHPGPQPRALVAEVLWPEAEPEAARRSLRVTLTELRKTIGNAALHSDRDHLALDSGGCTVDLLALHAALAEADSATPQRLHDALERWPGELLPHFAGPWLEAPRERLAVQRRRARLELGRSWLAQRDLAAARAEARALLDADAADEAAARLLADSLAAAGQRDAALEAVDAVIAAARALGREHEADTGALRRQLAAARAARAAAPGNLPRPTTSFVGREIELDDIETRLNTCRLLTLIGPGGSGKTRLALQAAAETAHGYPGGVWWVDLSPLAEPELVPQAIASVLGVADGGNGGALAGSAMRIGSARLLLLLDTCEHLRDAAAHAAERLLLACPKLQVLATSRQELLVPGEVVWHTPALSVPDARQADWRALADNDAIGLFTERARAASGLPLQGEANLRSAARICLELGGIPLALELAAAQCAGLSLEEVELGLGQALTLSRGESSATATPPDRQATLRGAIDWGWRLLPPAEQVLLRRLSVFAGGCTVEAAVAIASGLDNSLAGVPAAAAGASPDIAADLALRAGRAAVVALPVDATWIVHQMLESLTRRAMLQLRRSGNAVRFAMLDTLRAFAAEQCAAAGEREALRRAHLNHFRLLAQRCAAGLHSSHSVSARRQLEDESANFDAALEAAMALPDGAADALDLANTLCEWWLLVPRYGKAAFWLQQVLGGIDLPPAGSGAAAPPPVHDPRRLLALLSWAELGFRRGQTRQASQLAETALRGYEALGDIAGQARAWYRVGLSRWLAGDAEGTLAAARNLRACTQAGDADLAEYQALRLEAEGNRLMHRNEAAIAANLRCLELAKRRAAVGSEATNIFMVGLNRIMQGRLREGVHWLQSAARISRCTDERHTWTYVLVGLGQACLLSARPQAALTWYGRLAVYAEATDCAPVGLDAEAHDAALQWLGQHLSVEQQARAWAEARAGNADQACEAALAFDPDSLPEQVTVAPNEPCLPRRVMGPTPNA